jgi:polyphosphate:AMP phosphotransferase
MFESAELGRKISKAQFKEEEPRLREALLTAQFDVLEAARFPVVVVLGGLAGAGTGETVNQLHRWLDPHHLRVHPLDVVSEEARERPPMWPFWRALPPRGRTAIFMKGWYGRPLRGRATRCLQKAHFLEALARTERFERMLTDEGALLVKLWLHLSKKEQRRRLEDLEASRRTAWRVSPADWAEHHAYDRYRKVSEEALQRTSTGNAPWVVVDASDARHRSLAVGHELLAAMQKRLAEPPVPTKKAPRPPRTALEKGERNAVAAMDLSPVLAANRYERQLEKLQGRLNRLLRSRAFANRSLVAVFEGADAAGKGGAIERVVEALDARRVTVIPVAAPTSEERAQPYLWRFWRHLPRFGQAVLFDRSWYGRVLVERVEALATEETWGRAYAEINDFEDQLQRRGAIVCKFWLQISPAEQLRRFKEREKVGFKRYKITDEDWRNRKQWDAYQLAAGEMVDRTSTRRAPWTLVAANDKLHARISVLQTLVRRLESEL